LITALPPITINHTPPKRFNASVSQPARQVTFGVLLRGSYDYVSSLKELNQKEARDGAETLIKEIVTRGEKFLKGLSEAQNLDIWSHRAYDRFDTKYFKQVSKEYLDKLLQGYMIKFNDICENHAIKLSKDEMLLTRTIPLVPDVNYGNPFSIGKPDSILGSCPAAAMRGGFSEEEGIEKVVSDRVRKDKIKSPPEKICTGSTLYVIEPLKTCEVSGFDWRETGNVEINGFGSEIFRKHLDANKCSKEVDFASSVKFELITDKSTPDTILSVYDKAKDKMYTFRLITQHITPIQE